MQDRSVDELGNFAVTLHVKMGLPVDRSRREDLEEALQDLLDKGKAVQGWFKEFAETSK